MTHLRWLSQTLGVRASTSPQEREAADYIADQLISYGYQVEIQEFTIPIIQDIGMNLRVEGLESRTFTTATLLGSGRGEVTGPLTFVGLGREQDLPTEGLEGLIALIERGEITFRDKALNARLNGALGVVIFNNALGLTRGTLSGSLDIPVVGVSRDDGEELLRLLNRGDVTVTLRVVREERTSQNVVATKDGGKGAVLILGAHYDSVPESPGANDNGSGTAVLLTLAQELAQMDLPIELRFIAFGAEELGLFGSGHYVSTLPENERNRVVAMLNFDALGSGGLRVGGDDLLVGQILTIADNLSISAFSTQEPSGASSDHASFRAAGVPVAFFVGSEFPRIHTPNDRIEFVDPELLGQTATLGLETIASLARQGPGMPVFTGS